MVSRSVIGSIALVCTGLGGVARAQQSTAPIVSLNPASGPVTGGSVIVATIVDGTFASPASVVVPGIPELDGTILLSTSTRIVFTLPAWSNQAPYVEPALAGGWTFVVGGCGYTAVCPPIFDDYENTNSSQVATTLTLAPVSSPVVYGQPLTLTATLDWPADAGVPSELPGEPAVLSATFSDATGTLGAATATGAGGAAVMTLTTSALPAGAQQVLAWFEGWNPATPQDGPTYSPSNTQLIQVTVDQATSTVALSASPSTAALGQPVTVTAAVTAAPPGGGTATSTISLADTSTTPATSYGSATLDATGRATWTIAFSKPSTPQLVASYDGDSNFTSGTSTALAETVTSVVWDGGTGEVDSGVDGGIDGGTGAEADAGVDASVDAGVDASQDAGARVTDDSGASSTEDSGPPVTDDSGAVTSDDAGADAMLGGDASASDDAGVPAVTLDTGVGNGVSPDGTSGGGCSTSDATGSGSFGVFPLAAVLGALAARRRSRRSA